MIQIDFKENKIGTLSNNGGVFVGQNALYGWTGHVKQNNDVASSVHFGDHSNSINILIDRDVIDSHFFNADKIVSAGNFVDSDGHPMGNRQTVRSNGTSKKVEINGKTFDPGDL